MKLQVTIDWIYTKINNRILYPCHGFTRYGTDNFINYISSQTKANDCILDAGAGDMPYSKLFKHAQYESCDSKSVMQEIGSVIDSTHTFYCDLDSIPRSNNYFDKIICSQVLEHVKDPRKVISEFYRVLKPGGKLYITVPSIMGIHQAPHNYFNFLKFGLHEILNEAGFNKIIIETQGGIFWVVGKVLQKAFQITKNNIPSLLKTPLLKVIFLPLHIFFLIIIYIISFLLFHLDFLDREKDWTLNYNSICSK